MQNETLSTFSKQLTSRWQASSSHSSHSPHSAVGAITTHESQGSPAVPIVVLSVKQVLAVTGMSRSKLYALLDKKSRYFDPSFPPKARIGARSVGFAEHLVQAWLASRFEQATGGRK